jgi:hypothetical protein
MLWGAMVAGIGALATVLPGWLGLNWSIGYSHSAERAGLPLVLAAGAVKFVFQALYVGCMAGIGMLAGICAAWGKDPFEQTLAGLAPGLMLGGAGLVLGWAVPAIHDLLGPSLATVIIVGVAGVAAAAAIHIGTERRSQR